MFGISLQDDVKRSFEKVKEDIINVKRSVNRELLAVEEVGSRLQTFVAKDEFYSFIKRLGERLDRIDENIEAYLGYEDEIKNVDAKVKSLGKKLSRQEDLSGEIKEARALKGKLAALEGSTVSAQKFNEVLGKVSSDVSSVKAVMLTGKALDSLKAKLTDAEKRVERLEKSVPSKGDVSGSVAAVEEMRESIRRVEVDSQKRAEEVEKAANKKLEEVSGSLRGGTESIKASSVDKVAFEKSLRELKKETASIRNVLESSVSEVDFSDYVTKKELGKKLSVIEELNSEIMKLKGDKSDIENYLESLRRDSAKLEDVEKIGSDVKEISKSLDALKAAIEKVSDLSQKRFEQELEQAKVRFEKDISKLRDDFEDKLKRAEKEKAPAKEGVITRVARGFADFFKEEEEREVRPRVKPAPSVSELLKGEEKKKQRKAPGFGRFVLPVIIIIAAGVLFAFWMANKPIEGVGEVNVSVVGEEFQNESAALVTAEESPVIEEPEVNASEEKVAGASEEANVTAVPGTIEYCKQEYECKERGDGSYWFSCYLDEEGTCRCFVTDAEGCGIVKEKVKKPSEGVVAGKGKFGYLMAAVIVFVIFIAVYFSILRNNKAGDKKQKKEKEKGGERGVDLEEFFQKK